MIYTTADVLSLRERPIFSIVPSYKLAFFCPNHTIHATCAADTLTNPNSTGILVIRTFSFGFI